MVDVINTNIASLIARQRLNYNTKKLTDAVEHLASGSRINRTADDVSGNAISRVLMGDIIKINQATQNTQDGYNLLSIAEGALGQTQDILQRMRELTVQAMNDTNNQAQRNVIGQELYQLASEADRIAQATKYNGLALLDGTASSPKLQIGIDSTAATSTLDISAGLANARIDKTGSGIGIIDSGGSLTFSSLAALYNTGTGVSGINSATVARSFLQDLDTALGNVSSRRSAIGALQNQLDSNLSTLQVSTENFSAAHSRIRDVDIAKANAQQVQFQILQQASVSVLGQVNNLPQQLLGLLQH